MSAFWRWLIGEAGAGWIIGLLGFFFALYTWVRRTRPPRVVVQEVEVLRLLDVHPSQRTNLEVLFRPSQGALHRVQNLIQKKIVIYNSGSMGITDPLELEIQVSWASHEQGRTSTPFLHAVFDEPMTVDLVQDGEGGSMHTGIRLSVPYLNSYPLHQHYVTGYLVSNEDMRFDLRQKTGKGWSARAVSLQEVRDTQLRILRIYLKPAYRFCNVASLVLFVIWGATWYTGGHFRAVLNPSAANIQELLRVYEHRWLDLAAKPLPVRFLLGVPVIAFDWLGIYAFLGAYALAFVTLALLANQRRLASWMCRVTMGIQPPSRFVEAAEES